MWFAAWRLDMQAGSPAIDIKWCVLKIVVVVAGVVAAVVHDFHDKIKLLQQRVAWRLACAGLARPRPLRKMTEPNGSIKTQSMMMPTHAAPREGQERAVQAFQCPLRLCARVEGHDGPAALRFRLGAFAIPDYVLRLQIH